MNTNPNLKRVIESFIVRNVISGIYASEMKSVRDVLISSGCERRLRMNTLYE